MVDLREVYRSCIESNVIRLLDIVSCFGGRPPFATLTKLGALKEVDAKELKSMSDCSNRELAELVIRKIVGENELARYMGLSRFVFSRSQVRESEAKELFPFLTDEDHPELYSYHTRLDTTQLQSQDPLSDGVLWLFPSQQDFESTLQILPSFSPSSDVTTFTGGFQSQNFTAENLAVQLTLAYPCEGIKFAGVCPQILSVVRPKVAVFSGPGSAQRPSSGSGPRLGDVAVILRNKDAPFWEHMTELWRLRHQALWCFPGVQSLHPKTTTQELSLVLARAYLELKLPEKSCSAWSRRVNIRALLSCAIEPTPNTLWKESDASGDWEKVNGDVLPFRPCGALLDRARCSMRYAASSFPLPCAAEEPTAVLFRKASYSCGDSWSMVSPQAVMFYFEAHRRVKGVKSLAVLGVSQFADSISSSVSCRQSACHVAGAYMLKAIECLLHS